MTEEEIILDASAKARVAAVYADNAKQAFLQIPNGVTSNVLNLLLSYYRDVAEQAAESASRCAKLAVGGAVMIKTKMEFPALMGGYAIGDVEKSLINAQEYMHRALSALSLAELAIEMYGDKE